MVQTHDSIKYAWNSCHNAIYAKLLPLRVSNVALGGNCSVLCKTFEVCDAQNSYYLFFLNCTIFFVLNLHSIKVKR
uniref:Uncharacterized protein n=1 Tax=Anguilla anguilla TaxID=7936 RepID=A0A0E9WN75_ANGAN